MDKHQIIESLNNYHDYLVTQPNSFGLFEYEDPNEPWIPDIVSGRSEHEYTQQKLSRNPFSRKQVDVGSSHVTLGSAHDAKMNFFNKESGKYKRNDVEATKKKDPNKPGKDNEKFMDPSELGIHFDMDWGVPVLMWDDEMKHLLNANLDKIKNLEPELCRTKIEDPRFQYLSWDRGDIKKVISSGPWTDVNLSYIVTQHPISKVEISAVAVSNNGEFPAGATTTVPSGLLNRFFFRTDESENDHYMYLPKTEHERFVVAILKSGYIRYLDNATGKGGVIKINHNYPFIASK